MKRLKIHDDVRNSYHYYTCHYYIWLLFEWPKRQCMSNVFHDIRIVNPLNMKLGTDEKCSCYQIGALQWPFFVFMLAKISR